MLLRRAVATRLAATVAGAALACSGIGTGASAAAADGAGSGDLLEALRELPAFAGIADSLGSTAPVVLHGRLSEVAGTAMGGAVVLLSAWPSNDAVTRLPIGGTFATTPIARASAAPDGSYELRANLTPVLAGLLDSDGMDVEYDVFAGGRQYRYLSQIQSVTDGRWIRKVTDDLTAAAPTAGPGARNLLDVVLDKRVSAGFPNPFDHGDEDLRHPPEPYCHQYTKIDEQYPMAVVATAVARSGVTAQVKYTHDAKTQTSTGVSVGGGLFEVAGDRTRTAGFEADYPDFSAGPGLVVNEEYQTEVREGVFRADCARSYPYDGKFPDAYYVTSPLKLTGGGKPAPSRYPTWDCAGDRRREADAGYKDVKTEDERAQEYSAAFKFAPTKWGSFTGKALSGYNSQVQVVFVFDQKRPGYWCGDHGKPLDDDQRVQGYQK